jgi:hypothetical protein
MSSTPPPTRFGASRVTESVQRAQVQREQLRQLIEEESRKVEELQQQRAQLEYAQAHAQAPMSQFLASFQQSIAQSVAQLHQEVQNQSSLVSALLSRHATQAQTPRSVDLPYPSFSGSATEDVGLFLFTLNSVLDNRQITDEAVKLRVIPSVLKDGALAWARDALSSKSITTWDDFNKQLTETYTRPDLQIHLRDRLRTLRQDKDIESYTAQFRTIFNQVKDMSQLDAIHAYTRGLDPQVASRIHLSTIKTLDAVIAAALDNERAMAVLKLPEFTPMDTSVNVAAVERVERADVHAFNARSRHQQGGHRAPAESSRPKYRHHRDEATPGVVCYRCGQEGHMSRSCFNARKK